MGTESVNITYETLFDLFRNESKESLQQLPEGFYKDLVTYLQEKKSLFEDQEPSAAEKEKLSKQLQNVSRIIRDIYERRETKILHLAVIADDYIDTR